MTVRPIQALPAVVFAAFVASAAAQSPVAGYPAKPIRLVVPLSAGSATDLMARVIGPRLQESWGQQVVVDNRPSAGGTVAGSIVANAAPDGHTLMMISAAFAGSAALYDKLPYDPLKDFAPIAQVASTPLFLVVAPSLGIRTVKELIALAQQKAGQLNFGSSGIASGTHYAGELFKLTAGINVTHVPYRGTPESLNDTIAGRVQFCFAAAAAVVPLIKSGRLVALATSTKERQPMLPDVPTIAESALAGFEYDGWYGLLAPARTPHPIVDALASELRRAVRLRSVKDKIESQGASVKATTPQEFAELLRASTAMYRRITKAAGIKPE